MSNGLTTALGVIGILVLLEALDVLGALRRKIRGESSGAQQDDRIKALEARIAELERKIAT
jgi:hypothetical protein